MRVKLETTGTIRQGSSLAAGDLHEQELAFVRIGDTGQAAAIGIVDLRCMEGRGEIKAAGSFRGSERLLICNWISNGLARIRYRSRNRVADRNDGKHMIGDDDRGHNDRLTGNRLGLDAVMTGTDCRHRDGSRGAFRTCRREGHQEAKCA
jgi:hypothetical protein